MKGCVTNRKSLTAQWKTILWHRFQIFWIRPIHWLLAYLCIRRNFRHVIQMEIGFHFFISCCCFYLNSIFVWHVLSLMIRCILYMIPILFFSSNLFIYFYSFFLCFFHEFPLKMCFESMIHVCKFNKVLKNVNHIITFTTYLVFIAWYFCKSDNNFHSIYYYNNQRSVWSRVLS